MGWLIRAVGLYKSFVQMENSKSLDNLPPSKVWDLLHNMLRDTVEEQSEGEEGEERERLLPNTRQLSDHQIKQLNGCLLRVPDNFYPSVWQILSRCPGGIRFGHEVLTQLPTIRMHEPFELSFYHLVESFFAQYQDSCYRHLVIRVLTILAIVIKRNPEIQYRQEICIEGLIAESVSLFERNISAGEDRGIQGFHRLSCRTSDSYIGRAIVNTLLCGEIGHNQTDCKIQ
eukprot:TRINITY_DN5025_c0_g1_i9.p1 TRINITY_DN5025_c0_g1~~TRINITY_DN5025_c0_g1_i9.p1  ORF type:complete len:229 (+),score=32.54 TRINITY_DN5025_c0_g1_i9:1-687(+)